MTKYPATTTLLQGTKTLAQFANPEDERFGGLALLGGFILGNMMGNMNCQNGGCGGGMFGGGGCGGGCCGGGCGRPRPMAYGYPMNGYAPVPMAAPQQFQVYGMQPQNGFVQFQGAAGFNQQPVYASQPLQPLQPLQPVQGYFTQENYNMPTNQAFNTNKFFIQR
ncbi:MAG: hypothetical protein FWF59_13545 [Turicibacter sp.]|nr:hypothetical protein [Turicibacter sp.]